jgi:hypothetical protein
MNHRLKFAALTACFAACAAPQAVAPAHPVGVDATFIESPDVGKVTYRVVGMGADAMMAKGDALKVAIAAAIEQKIATGPDEKKRWTGMRNGYFAGINPVMFASEKKMLGSRAVNESTTTYEALVTVALDRLSQDLSSKGIAATADETSEAIGNPSIVAVAQKKFKKHAMAEALSTRINEYLQQHDFDVKNAQGMQDLQDVVSQLGEVAGHDEDEAAQIALALGAEVYMTYSATLQPGRGTVKVQALVRAYETTTGTALGDGTGWSAERPTASAQIAFDEAISDATSKVMGNMLKKWKKQAAKGKGYFLVFRGEFDGPAKGQIHRMVKALGKAKRTLATEQTLHYTVRIKGSPDDVMVDLEAELSGIGCKIPTQRGSMAVISCD